MSRLPLSLVCPLCLFVTVALGCSGSDGRTTVNVYAASSLADLMELVEQAYESDNPDVDVRMNLAGTNALVRQINSGADAAVLVAADRAHVDQLLDEPIGAPAALATNTLTLVVPDDNPAGIDGPEDLSTDGVLTARCATGVPCGEATDRYLETTGYMVGRATEETNVRSVLAKVSSGEVDAGFVYRTDASVTDSVTELPLIDPPTVTITMVQLADEQAADGFARYLRSDDVTDLLQRLGFGSVAER